MTTDLDPEDFDSAMGINRRQISAEQTRKFETYVAEIFTAYGMDLDTPSTRETPKRFIKAMFDATEGYDGDPKLLKVFKTECRGGPDFRLRRLHSRFHREGGWGGGSGAQPELRRRSHYDPPPHALGEDSLPAKP